MWRESARMDCAKTVKEYAKNGKRGFDDEGLEWRIDNDEWRMEKN